MRTAGIVAGLYVLMIVCVLIGADQAARVVGHVAMGAAILPPRRPLLMGVYA